MTALRRISARAVDIRSAMVRSGRLTRAQLRSSAWQRIFPDVYACATVELTHAHRVRAATELLLPGAVASGRRVLFVTTADLRHPSRLIARIAAALAATSAPQLSFRSARQP